MEKFSRERKKLLNFHFTIIFFKIVIFYYKNYYLCISNQDTKFKE